MVIMGETAVDPPIFQHMLTKAAYRNFLNSTVSQISHYYRQHHTCSSRTMVLHLMLASLKELFRMTNIQNAG